ncbi:MAG: putative Fimbrial assembly family protein [Candidatus Saccharibacteria bacterium]|nr:putative Fimbrial assembly family protein [Candidatus Saccharibacteria bacterium]
MIQFNLLPDVKVAYIKAIKAKRVVMVASGIAVVISLGILAAMFSAVSIQKNHIKDLNVDIRKYENDLSGTQDLAKILTIQNQLKSLPALYSQRPVTSRLYKYIQATTPAQISMKRIDLDFVAGTLETEGTADTLESVNRYVDTLKFTTYTTDSDKTPVNAFSSVILKTFNRDTKTASYTIDFNFDPVIFNADQKVNLIVPSTVTTRSETELPFDSKGTN